MINRITVLILYLNDKYFFSFVAHLARQIFNSIKGLLNQNEGLGYLQLFNLLKVLSIVVISIIYAKFIQNPLLINHWETLMLMGSGYTFFYVSGLGYTLISFIKKHQKNEWPQVFKNTFLMLFVFGIISCIAIILTGYYFKSMKFPLNQLGLFCIYILGTVCSTVVENIYFINKQYRNLFLWGIINFLLFIILPTIPLIYGYNFVYSLLFLAVFGGLKFIFTLTLIEKPFSFDELAYIKPLLKFNWPIILSLLFGTGYIYVASFIIKSNVSVIDFNLFRYGSREFPLFIVMTNSFSIVLGSITTQTFFHTDYWYQIKKSHLRLMHQLFPLACVLMLGSQFIFEKVFSVAFSEASVIFNILLLTILVRVLFPQAMLMGRGKTKFTLYSAMIEFAAGIIFVTLLTPEYGIAGAALGILLAYFIEKIALIFFCYRQKIEFHKSISWSWFIGYGLLLLLSFGWGMFY